MKNCAHKKCIDEATRQVSEICEKNHVKFTKLRQKIFEIIFQDHKAIKAYELLNRLKAQKIADNPLTVYRALDFFIENKIIHKIYSSNSYIICSHLKKRHDCNLFICEKCGDISEFCNDNLAKSIKESAAENNFLLKKINVEIVGICKKCA